jgi:hypothetical protein
VHDSATFSSRALSSCIGLHSANLRRSARDGGDDGVWSRMLPRFKQAVVIERNMLLSVDLTGATGHSVALLPALSRRKATDDGHEFCGNSLERST